MPVTRRAARNATTGDRNDVAASPTPPPSSAGDPTATATATATISARNRTAGTSAGRQRGGRTPSPSVSVTQIRGGATENNNTKQQDQKPPPPPAYASSSSSVFRRPTARMGSNVGGNNRKAGGGRTTPVAPENSFPSVLKKNVTKGPAETAAEGPQVLTNPDTKRAFYYLCQESNYERILKSLGTLIRISSPSAWTLENRNPLNASMRRTASNATTTTNAAAGVGVGVTTSVTGGGRREKGWWIEETGGDNGTTQNSNFGTSSVTTTIISVNKIRGEKGGEGTEGEEREGTASFHDDGKTLTRVIRSEQRSHCSNVIQPKFSLEHLSDEAMLCARVALEESHKLLCKKTKLAQSRLLSQGKKEDEEKKEKLLENGASHQQQHKQENGSPTEVIPPTDEPSSPHAASATTIKTKAGKVGKVRGKQAAAQSGAVGGRSRKKRTRSVDAQEKEKNNDASKEEQDRESGRPDEEKSALVPQATKEKNEQNLEEVEEEKELMDSLEFLYHRAVPLLVPTSLRNWTDWNRAAFIFSRLSDLRKHRPLTQRMSRCESLVQVGEFLGAQLMEFPTDAGSVPPSLVRLLEVENDGRLLTSSVETTSYSAYHSTLVQHSSGGQHRVNANTTSNRLGLGSSSKQQRSMIAMKTKSSISFWNVFEEGFELPAGCFISRFRERQHFVHCIVAETEATVGLPSHLRTIRRAHSLLSPSGTVAPAAGSGETPNMFIPRGGDGTSESNFLLSSGEKLGMGAVGENFAPGAVLSSFCTPIRRPLPPRSGMSGGSGGRADLGSSPSYAPLSVPPNTNTPGSAAPVTRYQGGEGATPLAVSAVTPNRTATSVQGTADETPTAGLFTPMADPTSSSSAIKGCTHVAIPAVSGASPHAADTGVGNSTAATGARTASPVFSPNSSLPTGGSAVLAPGGASLWGSTATAASIGGLPTATVSAGRMFPVISTLPPSFLPVEPRKISLVQDELDSLLVKRLRFRLATAPPDYLTNFLYRTQGNTAKETYDELEAQNLFVPDSNESNDCDAETKRKGRDGDGASGAKESNHNNYSSRKGAISEEGRGKKFSVLQRIKKKSNAEMFDGIAGILLVATAQVDKHIYLESELKAEVGQEMKNENNDTKNSEKRTASSTVTPGENINEVKKEGEAEANNNSNKQQQEEEEMNEEMNEVVNIAYVAAIVKLKILSTT